MPDLMCSAEAHQGISGFLRKSSAARLYFDRNCVAVFTEIIHTHPPCLCVFANNDGNSAECPFYHLIIAIPELSVLIAVEDDVFSARIEINAKVDSIYC